MKNDFLCYFKKEVIDGNTIPAELLLAGNVLANNLLLAGTPTGHFLDPSRTLLGPILSHYGKLGYDSEGQWAKQTSRV